MVAAFRDLDVGKVFRRQAEPWGVVVGDVLRVLGDEVFLFRLFFAHQSLNDRCDLGDLVQPDEGIHIRHQPGELLPESLG